MFLSLHIFRGHSAREPASAVCNDEVIMIMVVVVVVVVMIKMMVVVMKKRMVMMMNLSESASLHIICNEIYCAALSQSIACSHRQHPSAGERERKEKNRVPSQRFSPVQSLDRFGRRGDMVEDLAEILSVFFPSSRDPTF